MVRWAHMFAAVVGPPLAAVWVWAREERRRVWAPTAIIVALLFVLLLPLDGPISRGMRHVRLGGDVRRELEAIQQFGQGVSTCLVALAIWLQDPPRRRRLADWAAALLVCLLIVNVTKMAVGRPRPLYDDPWVFLGPLGQYPIGAGRGVHHAWEFWAGISSRLWSMPSSHTAYACVMAVFVGSLYPRLRWLVWGLAAVVGAARIVTTAHYVTDVVVGAGIGLVVIRVAIEREWGDELLAWTGRPRAGEQAGDTGSTGGGPEQPGGTGTAA